jgi:cytochrome d ubiquinol oxidase subunit II
MNVAAFILLALMLTVYILLDGYDLGIGTMHLFLGRNDRERAESFAAIGPFWNGNEVFIVAAAAVLFALFPRVYAASFSGFYLPFIILLWLFMVRGMAIELRGHFESDLWYGFWDVAFCVSSALLAFFFGLSLGNVLRGVPLAESGFFAGTFGFLFNGYSILVGVLALFALAMHGCAFLWMRTEPELRARAQKLTRALWPIVLVLFLGATAATLFVHPIPHNLVLWIAPLVALVALIALMFAKNGTTALACSSLFLFGLMISAAETLFPYLLPKFPIGSGGLDVYNASPGAYSLGTAFTFAIIGFGAALIYGSIAALRMLRASGRA